MNTPIYERGVPRVLVNALIADFNKRYCVWEMAAHELMWATPCGPHPAMVDRRWIAEGSRIVNATR